MKPQEIEDRLNMAVDSHVIEDVRQDITMTVQSLDEKAIVDLGKQIGWHLLCDGIDLPKGKIYLTGIGKPSFVAMKNAMTLKSIEVDAEYLDACTAGHGDLGSMPKHGALVIAMSKSGKSPELPILFKNLNSCRPGASIVLLTFNRHWQNEVAPMYEGIENLTIISLNCDPKEFDGYGLIPSSSNVGFESALAMAFAFAMKACGKDIELHRRLQRSHPSGTLQTKVSKLIEQEEQQ